MRNIETVPAIINIDVEWILRTEECIGIPFAGVIAVIARPSVVGEPLKMVAKTFVYAGNHRVVISPAEAGQRKSSGEWGKGAVQGLRAEDQFPRLRADCPIVRSQDAAAELVSSDRDQVSLPI